MNHQLDDQLETYLRSFRPLSPAPLPKPERRWMWLALTAAAALVIAVLSLFLPQRVPPARAGLQPMTIGSANQFLANSTSWRSALDDPALAFQSSSAIPAPRRGSALEFLSQENLSQ